jgi:hypothetical protein
MKLMIECHPVKISTESETRDSRYPLFQSLSGIENVRPSCPAGNVG